jgi:hypothetical protein
MPTEVNQFTLPLNQFTHVVNQLLLGVNWFAKPVQHDFQYVDVISCKHIAKDILNIVSQFFSVTWAKLW